MPGAGEDGGGGTASRERAGDLGASGGAGAATAAAGAATGAAAAASSPAATGERRRRLDAICGASGAFFAFVAFFAAALGFIATIGHDGALPSFSKAPITGAISICSPRWANTMASCSTAARTMSGGSEGVFGSTNR